MARLSQQDRIRLALAESRLAMPGRTILLTAPRRAYARLLRSEKWFLRTFYMTDWTWQPTWKGSEIDVLHELSYYVLPRVAWAMPRSKGEAWARRETAWSLLTLVQHKLGRENARLLRKAFVANGVKYRPRRLLTQAQREALSKRLKGSSPVVQQMYMPTLRKRRISFIDE